MATKKLVRRVTTKNQDGTLAADSTIGATFADIVDAAGSRVGATGYSLDQFFDSYMAFMQANQFVYSGNTQPTNSHVGIWLDTSVTNQDGFEA